MTTLTEAFGLGWERGKSRTKTKQSIAVPVMKFIGLVLVMAAPWTLPVLGLAFVIWAGFMVAVPLGLLGLGLACFIIRFLYEMQGR